MRKLSLLKRLSIMGIIVSKYARDRISEKEKIKQAFGPVITISRQLGCPAKLIAMELVGMINEKTKGKWTCVSKEILQESASKLGIPASELRHFFKYNEQGIFDGILTTISKFYPSDMRIYKAVENAIRSIGQKGKVVVVGRGGAAICRDMKNALHIRLTAPADWRLIKVMETHNIDKKQALQFMNDYDRKRTHFMMQFAKKTEQESLFDITYNCASLKKTEIAQSIFAILKKKKII